MDEKNIIKEVIKMEKGEEEKEKELVIRFDVDKEWDAEYGKYKAEITVMLPTDLAKELHPLLRHHKAHIAGEKLKSIWGDVSHLMTPEPVRYKIIEVYAKEYDELMRKVKEEIEFAKETIKEVIEENLKAIARIKGEEKMRYEYTILIS